MLKKKHQTKHQGPDCTHSKEKKMHLIVYVVAMTTGKNANVFSVLGPSSGLALHLDHE